MDNLRKAALLLASMAEADRAWLLAQLGEKERARLAPLLGELRELGIKVDADMLRDLEPRPQAAEPARPAPAAAPAAPSPRALDAAQPQAMNEVLAREPDWLVAAVARARPWPWREAFLRLLGTERRFQVQRALPAGVQLRPKALEALVSAIEKRLEQNLMAADELADEPLPQVPPAARKPFWREVLAWRR